MNIFNEPAEIILEVNKQFTNYSLVRDKVLKINPLVLHFKIEEEMENVDEILEILFQVNKFKTLVKIEIENKFINTKILKKLNDNVDVIIINCKEISWLKRLEKNIKEFKNIDFWIKFKINDYKYFVENGYFDIFQYNNIIKKLFLLKILI